MAVLRAIQVDETFFRRPFAGRESGCESVSICGPSTSCCTGTEYSSATRQPLQFVLTRPVDDRRWQVRAALMRPAGRGRLSAPAQRSMGRCRINIAAIQVLELSADAAERVGEQVAQPARHKMFITPRLITLIVIAGRGRYYAPLSRPSQNGSAEAGIGQT